MQTLFKGLSPAYLRFGGTNADYVIYSNEPDKVFEEAGVSPALHTYTSEYLYIYILVFLCKCFSLTTFKSQKRKAIV